jgi:DNA-binding response OmpR family regulator
MATILVVDDEEPIRTLLADIFVERGHRSLLARNGQDALDIIAQERPDLVLADVMMPLINGAELCRRLKADGATQSIPVILMSAAGRDVADGSGADDYLDKPFYLDEVEALVDGWLPQRSDSARE